MEWTQLGLQRSTQGIVSVLLSLKKNPVIRYQSFSNLSRRLAEGVWVKTRIFFCMWNLWEPKLLLDVQHLVERTSGALSTCFANSPQFVVSRKDAPIKWYELYSWRNMEGIWEISNPVKIGFIEFFFHETGSGRCSSFSLIVPWRWWRHAHTRTYHWTWGIILGRNDEGVIAVPLPKRRMRSFVADPRPALWSHHTSS